MNESKIRDPRMWEVWEKSGAIGSFESSLLRPNGLHIEAIAKHHAGPAAGNSTLSLGSKIINEGVLNGRKWSVTAPIVAVVAPGHGYKLRQVLRRLPEGTQSLRSVFGDRERILSKSSRAR